MFGGGWWWSVVCAVVGGVGNEPWVLRESILVVVISATAEYIVLALSTSGETLGPAKFALYLVV
jgi:5-formaminoimidazole-4-carboxamide-1-beta-D-ribofuranosyl 5'-monophosphate synthetase